MHPFRASLLLAACLVSAQETPTKSGASPGKQLTAEQLLTLSVKHYNDNDFAAAIKDSTAAIRLQPAFALAFYDRGIYHSAAKDFAAALTDYNEANRLQPNDREILFARAVVRQRLGDNDGAIADYGEAIRLKINNPDAYLSRASLRYGKRDFQGAIEDDTEALHRKHNLVTAYLGQRRRAPGHGRCGRRGKGLCGRDSPQPQG